MAPQVEQPQAVPPVAPRPAVAREPLPNNLQDWFAKVERKEVNAATARAWRKIHGTAIQAAAVCFEKKQKEDGAEVAVNFPDDCARKVFSFLQGERPAPSATRNQAPTLTHADKIFRT
ncbi:unnamed protein product [Amoebophrya sp. A120]|nr:unnamed protein product [Amoebophrya sp. A120]|eukprot:GSA120T00017129001.1